MNTAEWIIFYRWLAWNGVRPNGYMRIQAATPEEALARFRTEISYRDELAVTGVRIDEGG